MSNVRISNRDHRAKLLHADSFNTTQKLNTYRTAASFTQQGPYASLPYFFSRMNTTSGASQTVGLKEKTSSESAFRVWITCLRPLNLLIEAVSYGPTKKPQERKGQENDENAKGRHLRAGDKCSSYEHP